ncbi:hypothetical protein D3C72_1178460 [compost metagenome]
MAFEPFPSCKLHDGLTILQERLFAIVNHAGFLNEIIHIHRGGESRCAVGRDNMIRSCKIIPYRLRAVRAEEDCPGILHQTEVSHRLLDHQLQMLRRQPVNHLDSFLYGIHHQDHAITVNRSGGNLPPRQLRQLALHFSRARLCEVRRSCHENGRGHLVMLGLGQQVGGHIGRVRAVIGQNGDFAWPGDAVDIDSAVHLALRQRDEDVARAADLVYRLDRIGAVRQGCDRLRSADPVDLAYASFRSGDENIRVNACLTAGSRRRDHHDLRHARNLGRDDIHEYRGRISGLTARHVHTHTLQRANNLAQDAAVRLQIHPGVPLLLLMESADVGRSSGYSFNERGFHLLVSRLQLVLRDSEVRRLKLHAVKTFGITQKRGIAFFFDIRYNLLHGFILLR